MIALGIGYQRWSTVGTLTHNSYQYDDHITYDILKNIRIKNMRWDTSNILVALSYLTIIWNILFIHFWIVKKVIYAVPILCYRRNHLGYLADKPHFTGQKRDRDIAIWIAQCFSHLGLEVSAPSYTVLLSFPKYKKDSREWDGENGNNVSDSIHFMSLFVNRYLITETQ